MFSEAISSISSRWRVELVADGAEDVGVAGGEVFGEEAAVGQGVFHGRGSSRLWVARQIPRMPGRGTRKSTRGPRGDGLSSRRPAGKSGASRGERDPWPFERIHFVASPVDLAQAAPRPAGRRARPEPDRGGRRDRGARRRRADALDAARDRGHGDPGLRHEPRHRRLPDERIRRGRPARPAGGGRGGGDQPAPHAGDPGGRRGDRRARDQRGLDPARRPAGGAAAHPRRRPRAAGGAGGRRRAPLHPGGLDRLQLLGARPDPAHRAPRSWR